MNHTMSVDGFLMYLTSPEGSIFNPEQQDLFQDMSQPLAHYYISSSHNTYLMEDQLKGPSSVEAYIQWVLPVYGKYVNALRFVLCIHNCGCLFVLGWTSEGHWNEAAGV